ncbi:MAG: DMT family transporter [Candidatus Latescibacteria bacterium]|nr:DMT family transporter [Candidatus Latescibacterota bacterium]
MSAPADQPIGLRAGIWAFAAALLWGGNAVFIKMGLQGMPPIAMAGARFAIGALTVGAGALVAGISLRGLAGNWRGLGALQLVFVSQILLLNVGAWCTTASRAAVLINTYPFFTALFAHFLLPADRLSPVKVLGLLCAFAGVVLLFAESLTLLDTTYLLGDALVLGSGLFLGLRQVVLKRLVRGLHPYQVLFWQAALSLPIFGVLSLIWEREAVYHFDLAVIGALLYQGVVVAGLCFIIWVSLLRRHSASRLGVYSFATPPAGVLLSAALLNETISPALWASMALVAVGIAIVNREGG